MILYSIVLYYVILCYVIVCYSSVRRVVPHEVRHHGHHVPEPDAGHFGEGQTGYKVIHHII